MLETGSHGCRSAAGIEFSVWSLGTTLLGFSPGGFLIGKAGGGGAAAVSYQPHGQPQFFDNSWVPS